MKRNNKETFFGEIITITNTYNREKIYNGIKFNVQNYGLESFETRYKNLDKFYHKIQIKNAGGTESISNSLVPHKIVEEGISKKIKNTSEKASHINETISSNRFSIAQNKSQLNVAKEQLIAAPSDTSTKQIFENFQNCNTVSDNINNQCKEKSNLPPET